MNKTTVEKGRTCTIIILSATIIFIISSVIIGLCVRFLTEGKVQQIILITLICLLATVGFTSLIILEYRRRSVKKVVPTIRQTTVTRTRTNYQAAPTAPPMSNASSFTYAKDYTDRTTMQA